MSRASDTEQSKAGSLEEGLGRLAYSAIQAALLAGLLVSNVGQRVTFKCLGYSLADYPYFILLVVSGSFVVIFGLICAGIVLLTGGWLPESRTWRARGAFWAIGVCNALQGLGMVLANPYVAGDLQALLQQAVIPFTLATSAIALGSRFSSRQYSGVLLIVGGIASQLVLPAMLNGPTVAAGVADAAGGGSTAWWGVVFLLAQLPVAFAAVLQERAFQAVPVNVFQMMFSASAAQFVTLLVLAPLDVGGSGGVTTRLAALRRSLAEATHMAEQGEAGSTLLACVIAMLLAQLSQALVVKYTSAAFAVLCTALVLPASAFAFTQPSFMGVGHTERLVGTTPVALALVFAGVLCYRLGDDGGTRSAEADDRVPAAPSSLPGLAGAEPLLYKSSYNPLVGTAPPKICGTGVGIIQCEYSNARGSPMSLWEEGTLKEKSHSYGQLSSLSAP